jgi:hypothetical protein
MLRLIIDQQHVQSLGRKVAPQMKNTGALADATLAVDRRNDNCTHAHLND